ncbi:hypothetical protein AB0I51_12380 [Streptomyces sp. NPDC050549]|uniref:hypothetical protein n=1 Tax=Streptomyces sp. NPDC050549 TaxID=3155406 RepID=UPI00342BE680
MWNAARKRPAHLFLVEERAALAAGHQVVATASKAETVREQLLDAGDALVACPRT